MTTRTFTLLASALLLALPALGEKQAPPAPGAPRGFRLPAPQAFTLDNGLRVTLLAWGSVPKARVALALDTGNVDEQPGQVWLADLTGDLLKEGTATRTGAQVSEAAAAMGGALEVAVTEDRTELGGEVLSEFVPDLLRLVAEVATTPRLPESELARLKADRQRQLSIVRSQPQPLADEKLRAVLYGDHPYGRTFPTPEQLEALTLAQVRAFHAAGFVAARAHLYVAGRFDAAAVEKAAREAFGGWKRGEPARPNPPRPSSSRAVYLIDRAGSVQTTLRVALPVIDPSQPDYVPLVVTNTLLGGYFSSRITANIREDKGYCYSPFSQLSSRRRDTFWAENVDVTTAVTGPALKEILSEVERLSREAPLAPELDAVKNYIAGTFVLQNSTRAGLINQLEFLELHGLPRAYLEGFVARVQATTPVEVQQMAKKYLRPEAMAIVAVGDRKQIEAQLQPFGPLL